MTTAERVLARLVLLQRSGDYWTTISDLAGLLDVPRRAIEEAVEDLRLAGHPIVGGGSGVKLTRNVNEIRDYVQSRRSRTLAVAKGTRAMLAAARRLEDGGTGQTSLRLA